MSATLAKHYHRFPAWLQNLGVTWYGFKIYRREYGEKFRRLLSEFEAHGTLTPDEMRAWQEERLRRLIRHAYDQVPYYRDLMQGRKLAPDDIRTLDDLAKLPILTADDIRKSGGRLVAGNVDPKRLHRGHTSGTTGSPLQFFYDDNICLVKNVVDWRQKYWAGIEPGDRIAFYLGRMVVPREQTKPPFWRYNAVMHHLFFSSFHMSAEHLAAHLAKLREFGPKALEGYPSTMSILAGYLLSRGETFPVKAVFTSSETLHPVQREKIEAAFQCKVFDFFGMAERVVFATECDAHQGHHVNGDFGITEITDGNGEAVQPGKLGFITATGLHNFSMPLIRYRTTDVTSLRPQLCSCGRPFPLMDDVTTKAEDIITTPDGRFVASSILTHPFKPLTSIVESQIIQEERSHVVVKVVPKAEFTERDAEYIRTELAARLGKAMNIEIVKVDSIPRTKAGKFRWVISKVPMEF